MTVSLVAWMQNALRVAGHYVPLMSWNLFLAVVPLVLSFWLFRRMSLQRTAWWWLGVAAFVLFLPNAPYVLTDIIHFIHAVRFSGHSAWLITLVLLPQFFLFISAGFLAYVFCLLNVGTYLQRLHLNRWILTTELTLHALSAVGIFLGRFLRLNSWDAIARPSLLLESIAHLLSAWPIFIIGITFVILSALYGAIKPIALGQIRYPSAPAFAPQALPPA